MGRLHRLITLVGLCLLAQACNSTDVAQASVKTKVDGNTLKVAFKPQTTIQVQKDDFKEINDYGSKALDAECERQSWVPWCENGVRVKKTHRLTPEELQKVSKGVQANFVYTSDVVDTWNSYAALAEAGEDWHGDCDDLTSTTLDMLHRAGQPLNKMWMLLNNVRSRGPLDHIVGIIQDSNGMYWVVGDTDEKNVYPMSQMPFSPRSIVRMDEKNSWVAATESPVFKNYPRLLGKAVTSKASSKRR